MPPDWVMAMRNATLTFFIGLIAGISPFIFMQVLPSLMNPDVPLEINNYLPIGITGILVGSITSVIFTPKIKDYSTQDIFFYALGVPAVLIATVSNLSIDFNARNKIDQIKENASQTVQLNSVSTEKSATPPEEDSRPLSMNHGLFFGATAWATESSGDVRKDNTSLKLAQTTYLLIIQEYADRNAAWAAYDRYGHMRLRTETYIPKRLGVYNLGSGKFALAYGRYTSQQEAENAYKLMRINDPNISARLLQY